MNSENITRFIVGLIFLGIAAVLAISARGFNDKAPVVKQQSSTLPFRFNVREFTANGETHEYIYAKIDRGACLSHLPNCKYCKEKAK